MIANPLRRLSNAEVRAWIAYDPATGALVWKASRRGVTAGTPAGCVTGFGYVVVKIDRTQVRAHRLAWFLTHGSWPAGEVDHINGNRADNRLANLRVVDRAGNSQNRRRAASNNSHGFQGVSWNKQHQRWQSKLVANKVRHHLGYFDTPDAAHAAYMEAKARLHISGGAH